MFVPALLKTLALGLPDLPLHPILVNFTAALVPVSVASDVAGRLARRPSLANVGFWTLVYAAAITPATAFAGWWWMRSMGDMDHWQMPIHMWMGISFAVALPFLALWRLRAFRRGAPAPWGYLAVISALVLALMVQGHLGGMMSFGSEDAAPAGHAAHDMPGHADAMTRPGPPATLQWRESIHLQDTPPASMPGMKGMDHGH
jgi:uncharacterized membrane protein